MVDDCDMVTLTMIIRVGIKKHKSIDLVLVGNSTCFEFVINLSSDKLN